MKNQFLRNIVAVSCMIVSSLFADEISTQLAIYYTPVNDYFLHWHRPIDNCLGLLVEGWGGGYSRSAFSAYGNRSCNNGCQLEQKNPKVPLTQLIFGKPDFTLAETFPNGIPDGTAATNPFVSIATLSPRFSWDEKGAFFGAHIGKRSCDDSVRYGVRIRLPYREIKMTPDCSGSEIAGIAISDDTLSDVFQTRQETITDPLNTNEVFAARLDFLSALQRIAFGSPEALVQYPATGDILIAQQAMSGGVPTGGVATPNAPAVSVIGSANGAVPTSVRWGDQTTAAFGTVLQGDGSGVPNLQRGRVASDTNYTALGANTTAQGHLFVVPNLDPTTNQLTNGANVIFAEITAAVSSFSNSSIIDFIDETGLDFCNRNSRGLGDLDLEWYAQYEWCQGAWFGGILGFRIPTAHKLNNPVQALRQPLGNNGHLEIRPGFEFGYEGCSWLRLRAEIMYSFVLKSREILAAAFEGSTVRGINPCAPACVSWQYMIGHFDLMFLNPRNQCMGFTIGYEPYVKRADKVCFTHKQGFDLGGVAHDLDATIIKQNTKRVAHKIRTEIFTNTECVNIFAGFDAVVAGKNITKDTDMYIGLLITF